MCFRILNGHLGDTMLVYSLAEFTYTEIPSLRGKTVRVLKKNA